MLGKREEMGGGKGVVEYNMLMLGLAARATTPSLGRLSGSVGRVGCPP